MSAQRIPNGWIVLGGSVLASFVWWMVSRPSNRVTPAPAPAPAATAAPVETTPAVTSPVKPPPPAPTPRASTEAPGAAASPEPAPAPVPVAPLLRVVGDVAGADVFVDRTFVGKTPFETRDDYARRPPDQRLRRRASTGCRATWKWRPTRPPR